MINQASQVVCDSSKIILEDHVCLYPGYLTVTGGQITQNFSDDPNNSVDPFIINSDGTAKSPNPEYKIGMLTNRKEFRRVEEVGPAPTELTSDTFHFINADAMDKYLESVKEVSETVEDVVTAFSAPSEAMPTDPVTEEFKPFETDEVVTTEEVSEVKDGLLPEEIVEEPVVEPVVKEPKKESRVEKVVREIKEKIPMTKEKVMVSDPIPESIVPASFVLAEDGQNRCSVCSKRFIEVEQKEGVDAHVASHA